MNPKLTPKERNLIKGAIRRIFSRSDLHRQTIEQSRIPNYLDLTRPRVKKWSMCPTCQSPVPTYLMQVDHIIPIIPLNTNLEYMTLDELIDRIWCDLSNLKAICKPCHLSKSKHERKLRKELKGNLKVAA